MVIELRALERELTWFSRLLDFRFRQYFTVEDARLDHNTISDIPPPPVDDTDTPWLRFVRERELSLVERITVVLALVPHLRPQLLDVFFTRNATFDRRFTEFGGVMIDDAFEPTAETLAFILGGSELSARVEAFKIVDPRHPLVADGVLACSPQWSGQPRARAPLRIGSEYLALFTTGERPQPIFSTDFPAQRIETHLEWEDLVLHPGTQRQVQEIQTFIRHGHTLLHEWGMAKRLRPGYRALFYGPPGTGKTMCAALLGKLTGLEVFRIDLSLIVSKYIGETEKNLARVFAAAQRSDMILFFDESDALFSKRTEIKDSHDLHANQQIAYLLQRIETFDGIAILASNLKDNLDDAFGRRFESTIYFPLPRAEDRLQLWQRAISEKAALAPDVDLESLANEHELSGGAIVNAIRFASVAAIAEGQRPITRKDLKQGIRRELAKEGRRA